MNRESYNNIGIIKEFNNGNINLKFYPDSIETMNGAGGYDQIEALSWLLDSLDCYLVGEGFCLSNFDMGVLIYNAYIDKCYILSFADVDEKMMQGQTLKLYAFEPSEDDREEIANYCGFDVLHV